MIIVYVNIFEFTSIINPLASPSEGAPALNYGDVKTETTSPGEVKGLISIFQNNSKIIVE